MDNYNLLFGDNCKISNNLEVKNPTLFEVKELGYDTYISYRDLLILTPWDIGDILYFNMNIWYEDISQWQMFLDFFRNDSKAKDALKWFLNVDKISYAFDENNNQYLIANEDIIINEHEFLEISNVIRQINHIPDMDKDISNSSKFVKIKKLERMQYDRGKSKKSRFKELITFESLISSLAWCSPNINILNIGELTIYQLYDGYARICARDNYEKTMQGIYAGTLDGAKVNLEHIYWANVLNKE